MKKCALLVLLMAAVLMTPAHAFAHDAGPIGPEDVWKVWHVEPETIIALAALLALYAFGVQRIWRRAGVNHGIRNWQAFAFIGGWLALCIAQASPLDIISGALLSAHMVQHMLLILLAAPLLAMSGLPIALMFVLPARWARAISHFWRRARLHAVWRRITHPLASWVIFAGALWLWHAPLFYQAALTHENIHLLEHSTFVIAAALSWWWLFKPGNKTHRYGLAVIFLFTFMLQSGALGALMAFSTQAWYPAYGDAALAWGLTPLEDQQLAGLIMWVPMGLIYTAFAVICMVLWLNAMDQRSQAHVQTQPSGGAA